jgi:hypothetical protein
MAIGDKILQQLSNLNLDTILRRYCSINPPSTPPLAFTTVLGFSASDSKTITQR